jgi:hypothetical protein
MARFSKEKLERLRKLAEGAFLESRDPAVCRIGIWAKPCTQLLDELRRRSICGQRNPTRSPAVSWICCEGRQRLLRQQHRRGHRPVAESTESIKHIHQWCLVPADRGGHCSLHLLKFVRR